MQFQTEHCIQYAKGLHVNRLFLNLGRSAISKTSFTFRQMHAKKKNAIKLVVTSSQLVQFKVTRYIMIIAQEQVAILVDSS